jgi:hypothetical protein
MTKKILMALLAMSTISAIAGMQPYAKNFDGDMNVTCSSTEISFLDGEVIRLEAIKEKSQWPGVTTQPTDKYWDLSKYAGICYTIKNCSDNKFKAGVRVDNPGEKGYVKDNSTGITIPAGETKDLKIVFGTSYGNPGKPIDTKKITGATIFFSQPKVGSVMEIIDIKTFGEANPAATAPIKRNYYEMQTDEGVITLNASPNRLDVKTLENGNISAVAVASSGKWPAVSLNPAKRITDLSLYSGVEFTIKNTGTAKLNLGLRVDNKGADGKNHCNTEKLSIPVGETATKKITFGKSWGNKGFNINTKEIINFMVFMDNAKDGMSLEIIEIKPWGQAARTAEPQKDSSLGFESKDEFFTLHGGEITKDKELVISGDSSIHADADTHNGQWFEFLTTTPGLLEGGYEYEVTYKYRFLKADEDSKLYSLFRSKNEGWGKFDRDWKNVTNLTAKIGEVHTQTYIGRIGELNDYMLMFGVNQHTEVVIDDVTITQGKPYVEPTEEEKYMQMVPENAETVAVIDFEKEDPNVWKVPERGTLKKDGAIKGEQSLYVNSTTKNGQWANILRIGPNWDLMTNGYTYYVYGYIKTVSKKQHNSQWFGVAQAKSGGKKAELAWKNLGGRDGKSMFIFFKFTPQDYKDYAFTIGTKDGVEGYIDNITIKRVKADESKIKDRKPLDISKAELVFEDNFDGTKVNTDVWNAHDKEKRRGGLWLKETMQVKDGNLEMIFNKNEKGEYIMGCIDTPKTFNFTYGYVEARMKNPKQVGHWPGIWLMTQSVNHVGNEGNDGTEVDIVEAPWRNKDEVSHALHWDGYGADHQGAGHHPTVPGINEGFHTYAVDWSEDGYIFFIDGKETWRTDQGGVCDVPLFLMISDEEGGWSGNPAKATNLPDKTYVDYIRVWQKK